MNPTIINEMISLVAELGEHNALAEVLDSVETALGPDNPFAGELRRLRDMARKAAGQ